MTIENIPLDDWLHRCIRCGNCKYIFRDYNPSCPSGDKFRFETYFASGRLRIAQGIENGSLTWDKSLLDPLFACTTCGNCEAQCLAPHKDHIVDVIEEIRAKAVEAIGPLPKHREFSDKVRNNHNPYGAEHHNREIVEIHKLPDAAPLVYFIGCTSNYRETAIRDATISILKKAGLDFTVVDEHCCGSPLLRTGQREQVWGLAEHNLSLFKKTGAQRVVTSCAGCFRTLNRDYTRMGVDLEVEVIHVTRLLQELFREGKLILKKTEDIEQVTWHDPCHLGRHMGIYEEPRQVLSALPVDLVEMSRHHGNSWCCGAGGGVRAGYSEWSLETAKKRINEVEETGAKTVVSGCPFCEKNLRDADSSNDVKVLDICELVDKYTDAVR